MASAFKKSRHWKELPAAKYRHAVRHTISHLWPGQLSQVLHSHHSTVSCSNSVQARQGHVHGRHLNVQQ